MDMPRMRDGLRMEVLPILNPLDPGFPPYQVRGGRGPENADGLGWGKYWDENGLA